MTKELFERLVKVLDGQIAYWGHKQIVKGLTPYERAYLEQLKDDRLMLIKVIEHEF